MSGRKTVLFDSCRAQGARFIDFAGWRLPFSFTSPNEEHLYARSAGAFFDVSHMGEIRIQGRDSLRLLQKALPTNIGGLAEGRAQYSALLNRQGGLIDDLIAYCLKPGNDYLLCVNAGPKERVFSWIKAAARDGGFELSAADESDLWAVIAVQGPKALALCEKISGLSFSKLKRFCFLEKSGVLFSRTGYTGEDGLEIYLPTARAPAAWRRLAEAGKELGAVPAGLAARDTLRLEAGYLLSGQDFDESLGLKGAGLLRLRKNPEKNNYYIGKGAVPAKDAEGEVLRAFVFALTGRGKRSLREIAPRRRRTRFPQKGLFRRRGEGGRRLWTFTARFGFSGGRRGRTGNGPRLFRQAACSNRRQTENKTEASNRYIMNRQIYTTNKKTRRIG